MTATAMHSMGITMTSTDPKRARQTWQRTAIRDHLAASEDFLTAQQVHDGLSRGGDRVGLATVYRTLQSMLEAGEVDSLRTPEGELAYRACSQGHHHHLVCRGCGLTVEIGAEDVERWAAAVAAAHGFKDVEHDIELYGLCSDCSAHQIGH